LFFLATHIPEEKISEIRHAVDIVDVVSESVLLRKAGKNFTGLCPFHSEKTPSFTVSSDKQIFYCFGCGTGGNVFSFLMKRDGMTFVEAARSLAERGGVDLPRTAPSARETRRLSEQAALLEANRMAADFFHGRLVRSPGPNPGRDYLVRRGITPETMEAFHLGYAPKGWDTLLGFMARKNVGTALLEKAGLVVPRKDGSGFYDRFRDRIIFPIYDENSRVVGFGGRVLDQSTPKYLNSPETPVYTKRRLLFGLQRARDACRSEGTVFIVEGYLDLIALHQHGISNSVATLGTSLTPEHIRLLTRYATHMVLVYDSDDAGLSSARRCIDIFWKEHVDFRRGDVFREERADTRILVLPKGHDPDSFVFQKGAEAFRTMAGSAPGIITFLMDRAVETHGLATEGKIRVVAEMLEPLAAVNDPVARALYVQQLAERVGLSESIILERLNARPPKPRDRRPAGPSAGPAESPGVDQPHPFERRIIAMMLQLPEIIPEIVERGILNYFSHAGARAAGETIARHRLTSTDQLPELLVQVEDATVKTLLTSLAISDESWNLKGCRSLITRFLEARQKQGAGRRIQKAIESAEKERDEAEVLRLLSEKQKLAVRREKQKMSMLRGKQSQ
jgi:DNA primase